MELLKFLKYYWSGADLKAKVYLVLLPIQILVLLLEIVLIVLLVYILI